MAHEIPWTDQSVKDALTIMQDIVGESDNMAGGTEAALQTEMPASVAKVFNDSPKAAMVVIGDFAPGVVRQRSSRRRATTSSRSRRSTTPGRRSSAAATCACNFKDERGRDAFLEYLTTPEAAEIWAARGGFSSPNKNLDPSVYPDEITRTTAGALAEAEEFRFDLSDLVAVGVRRDAGSRAVQGVHGLRRRTPTTSTGSRSRWRRTPTKAYGS